MNPQRRIKKEVKIALGILVVLVLTIGLYVFLTGKVSSNSDILEFRVEQGDTYSTIADELKENNLIKSEFIYKLYIKINKPDSLMAGVYDLRSDMSLKELIETLENNTKHEMITITFKEGINFRNIATLISDKTGIKKDLIYRTIEDKKYLDELIDKYWFLTDDIKKSGIYYSLEGYLFPDTYNFDPNSSIKDILEFMLDNTEKKLDKYKNSLKESDYSIHEMMTMASIVELEASNSDDRAGVAGVFYNRLESGWSLGSDVTTYYAEKIDLNERDLYQSELDEYNDYNTRSSKMAGKLPISPICIPGLDSIEAAFNPESHKYYYFVADKNGKTYFNKTSKEHTSTVSKLKSEGLWYTY